MPPQRGPFTLSVFQWVSFAKEGWWYPDIHGMVCIKGFIIFNQGLKNRQGGSQLGCAEPKSGASALRKGWEQRCLGCQRPVETCSGNQGNFLLEPAQRDELLPNNWLLKGPGNSAAPPGAGAAWVTFSHCPFVLNVPSVSFTIVVELESHRLKPTCPAQGTLTPGGALRSLHVTAARCGSVSPPCHQV